jgi:hypothetical protein
MATVFVSQKPCALCESTELTFEAKVPNLQGVLCAKCLHKKAGTRPPKKPKKSKSERRPEQT